MKTNIVLHFSKAAESDVIAWQRTLQSVFAQTCSNFEVSILNETRSDLTGVIESVSAESKKVRVISANEEQLAENLRKAFSADVDFHLYLDNRAQEVTLKKSALELCLIAVKNNPNTGMIYADYDLLENGQVKEVRLLKHHIGRVRDNQDYGKVFFFSAEAIKNSGALSSEMKFNVLYDLRLRISEKSELLHISNRYAGSMYQVVAQSKAHNVFDYLLASKDSQLEAEQILTSHLNRIGAYLEPGSHYSPRPKADTGSTLKASVIIPVNNRPEFICDAIESVQAQTVKEVEVIVVVNGGDEEIGRAHV